MAAQTTRVLPCSCQHDFQDKKYGKGKRLMNLTIKRNPTVWRCTVCGKERNS